VIVVAENQFRNPFDDPHITPLVYQHLGSDIGRREAERFKAELTSAIQAALQAPAPRSPVYIQTQLVPPAKMVGTAPGAPAAQGGPAVSSEAVLDQNVGHLIKEARDCIRRGDFSQARQTLAQAHSGRPDDVSIVQQLALATYRSKQPDPLTALKDAQVLLQTLNPETTNDAETMHLWGSVLKRLWETTGDPADLDRAIAAYDRGFTLTENYYSGISLAFLLDLRASLSASPEEGEAIADAVVARRIRKSVIRIVDSKLDAGPTSGNYATTAAKARDVEPSANATGDADERYWLMATLLEASIGIGDSQGAANVQADLEKEAPSVWMVELTRAQIDRLKGVLAKSPLARQ
jgi:hypothetical protein